ncbi:hypothetical protein, no similarity [Maudiozyma barnettii]|uniref:Uncharacterized protein n=1 Tax=Maudiozyma barnettii TaxID=61262 RepID=A0A8H2ZGB6_9SACH|nr:hypothetical protein, no similarity [Kazachstania barnettii]CAB4253144.1 hypothetical protein, no similarity [Kazachstania barnettii]CAD1780320.1 hypothetical protein, no similarity [Kazachstania barnettii]
MSRRSATVLNERPIQKRDPIRRATTIMPDAISINDLKVEIFSLRLDNEKIDTSSEHQDSKVSILDEPVNLDLMENSCQQMIEESYSSNSSDTIENQTANINNCIVDTTEAYIQNSPEKENIHISKPQIYQSDSLPTKEETPLNIQLECDTTFICDSNYIDNHSCLSHDEETTQELTEQKTSEDKPDSHDLSINHHKLIHKPLKQLIYQTNRNLYNVDSSRVQHRAGLSKSMIGIPSLHPNRTR